MHCLCFFCFVFVFFLWTGDGDFRQRSVDCQCCCGSSLSLLPSCILWPLPAFVRVFCSFVSGFLRYSLQKLFVYFGLVLFCSAILFSFMFKYLLFGLSLFLLCVLLFICVAFVFVCVQFVCCFVGLVLGGVVFTISKHTIVGMIVRIPDE